MDCDFSHDPKVLPLIFEALKKEDMVIGSRYIPQGEILGWPLSRKILSWGANYLARFILGLKTKDNTSGFRGYRSSFLKALPYYRIKSEGYSFFIEINFWAQKKKFRIKEIPIHFRDRQRGKSKISHQEIIKAFLTLIRLFFKRFF
jgi:glycosyltransferase involved in cell wall biosynthesis